MNKLKKILLSLSLVICFMVGLPAYVSATDVLDKACTAGSKSAICEDKKEAEKKTKQFIKDLVNNLLYILGAISVIVIIFAGIIYTTSSGNPEKVTQAKNTLTYAVVGIMVALSAYAIVNFVIGML